MYLCKKNLCKTFEAALRGFAESFLSLSYSAGCTKIEGAAFIYFMPSINLAINLQISSNLLAHSLQESRSRGAGYKYQSRILWKTQDVVREKIVASVRRNELAVTISWRWGRSWGLGAHWVWRFYDEKPHSDHHFHEILERLWWFCYHFLTSKKAVRRAVPRMTAARAQMMLKVPELTPWCWRWLLACYNVVVVVDDDDDC